MANSAPTLNLVDLDYDALLASLKAFVAADGHFKSYDLNQGGMAALLRVLAYASYNNAFMLNMVASESFLDSAQLAASVASHVKELGYMPASARSARARVRLSWTDASASVAYLQKGSSFSGLVRGSGAVTFAIPETTAVIGASGSFTADLDVYEGPYVADAWVVDSTLPRRYLISNPAVDDSSVSVLVYEGSSSQPVSYVRSDTFLGVTDTSRVWFMQLAETGQYEVLFGDGVLGYLPPDGSRVVADYRVTKGDEGNGVTRLTASFSPSGNATSVTTSVLETSSGGQPAETIEQSRTRAPRFFQTQQRAVSSLDYGALLTREFSEVRDAIAIGGDAVDPPLYGRVLVAVDLSDADVISESRREAYEKFLLARASLTTRPVVVDPDRAYVQLRADVSYDPTIEAVTPEALRATATAAAQAWCATNLGGFGAKLRLSRLQAAIDASSISIVSNDTRVAMYKNLSPMRDGVARSYVVAMGLALAQTPTDPGSSKTRLAEGYTAWTSEFTSGGTRAFVADDGLGVMRLVKAGRYGPAIGTVDYDTGRVALDSLAVDDYFGSFVRVYARAAGSDLVVPAQTVLSLGDVLVTTHAVS